MNYKLKVEKRDYSSYTIISHLTYQEVELSDFTPAKHHLFHEDVFQKDEDSINIVHSIVRNSSYIPGVLVTTQTYGKYKDKSLYKCLPDDTRLPAFLIPYTPKIGFAKQKTSKYVVFRFADWSSRHPRGVLLNVLGDVEDLNAFYEYEMYCRSLYASIKQFTKATMKALQKTSETEYIDMIAQRFGVTNCDNANIYTIDPRTSRDFDDAFSIQVLEDHTLLSIYIANVTLWLDALDLWNSFSNRVATIYLPDRKRPMLPTVLSDALCSLQEGRSRFAFVLDIQVIDGEIVAYTFSNKLVKVARNLRYDTTELEELPDYHKLFETVRLMNRKQRHLRHIETSHQTVAYLMILMNYLSAKKMLEHQGGIYRSMQIKPEYKNSELPAEYDTFLKGWNSSGGKYVLFSEEYREHDILDLEMYTHITSPIRRLVDLLNISYLQNCLGLYTYSGQFTQFWDKWTKDGLVYINNTMKSIRKVQNECAIITRCETDPDVLKREHVALIFNKLDKNDGLFHFTVYFQEFNLVLKYITNLDLSDLTFHYFQIYYFVSASHLKQKVRIKHVRECDLKSKQEEL